MDYCQFFAARQGQCGRKAEHEVTIDYVGMARQEIPLCDEHLAQWFENQEED